MGTYCVYFLIFNAILQQKTLPKQENYKKAMEIYKSEKFQDSVDATYMLGYMFFMGLGIEKDYEMEDFFNI